MRRLSNTHLNSNRRALLAALLLAPAILLLLLVFAPDRAAAESPVLSAGESHSCAVDSTGHALCWGTSQVGALGVGDDGAAAVRPSTTPRAVVGLGGDVSAISSGAEHTCAIKSGAVYCWGEGSDHRLGNLSDADQLAAAAAVDGLGSGVLAISAGSAHTCAIVRENGENGVKCWGSNDHGQVTRSSADGAAFWAHDVPGLSSGVTAISAGDEHSCAVQDGSVVCWGADDGGDGPVVMSLPLFGLFASSYALAGTPDGLEDGVSAVTAGDDFSCALKGGSVFCWGEGSDGQLGDGQMTDSDDPVSVDSLGSGVTAISASGSSACAVKQGELYCWGDRAYGQIGSQVGGIMPVPLKIDGFDAAVTDVSVGATHNCATTTDRAWCWGWNTAGEVGDGAAGAVEGPVEPVGLSGGVSALDTGWRSSCAVQAGDALCWGENNFNDMPDSNYGISSDTPGPVPYLGSGVTDVALGTAHGCATTVSGASCWGATSLGRLGGGEVLGWSFYGTAWPVSDLTSAGAIDAGDAHTCAQNGTALWCWGDNLDVQLGTTVGGDHQWEPQRVTDYELLQPEAWHPLSVSSFSAGGDHTCAIDPDSHLWCWGDGDAGQLGYLGYYYAGIKSGPRLIDASNDPGYENIEWREVSAGTQHTCAIRQNTNVFCWGSNTHGQLGDGSDTRRTEPVAVIDQNDDPLENVIAISAGTDHSCAVVGDSPASTAGAVFCWGSDASGQVDGDVFGDGDDVLQASAVDIGGLQATAVSTGLDHTCALMSDGSVRCWGANFLGQLGNDETWVTEPTQIAALILGDGNPGNDDPGSGDPGTGDPGSGTPGSPSGPGTSTPPTATPLAKLIKVPKSAKVGKAITVKLSCPAGCTLNLSAKAGKKKVSGLKSVKVKKNAKSVKIKLPKKAVTQIRQALKKNKKTKVVLTIQLKGVKGKAAKKTVRIK